MIKTKSPRVLAALLPLLAFAGCHKELDLLGGALQPMKRQDTYSIPAGGQYCTPKPLADMGGATELRFSARLRGSTGPLNDSELESYNQVNKLFGFSDCGNVGDPQNDSARVGWIWTDGKMLVLPFVDENHNHHYDLKNPLAAVELDRFYEYTIRIDDDRKHYTFTIADDSGKTLNTISIDRYCDGNPGTKIMSFPYFGGTHPAPHAMAIDLNLLD